MEAHNIDKSNGHRVGLNSFSDFSHREYKHMLGYKPEMMKGLDLEVGAFDTTNLKDSIDWRDQGAVSPVKN
jgi:hypothetical protein